LKPGGCPTPEWGGDWLRGAVGADRGPGGLARAFRMCDHYRDRIQPMKTSWAFVGLTGRDRSMITQTAIDLDCSRVIPECGYACSKCIQEVEITLMSMAGVSKVYVEEGADEGNLIVDHDPSIAAAEQLLDAVRMLPSFCAGFFIPTVIAA